jgi:hypothetical protein
MDSVVRLQQLLKDRQSGRKSHPIVVNPFTRKPIVSGELVDVYPAGASKQDIRRFTDRTGIRLSTSLQTWLAISNGPAGFLGIPPGDERCSIEQIWNQHPDFRETSWIPVARDDFGNFYVQVALSSSPEIVHFVESIGGYVAYAVASNMLRFAEFYLEGEKSNSYAWPFDKRFVLSRDPELANAWAVLAWESSVGDRPNS